MASLPSHMPHSCITGYILWSDKSVWSCKINEVLLIWHQSFIFYYVSFLEFLFWLLRPSSYNFQEATTETANRSRILARLVSLPQWLHLACAKMEVCVLFLKQKDLPSTNNSRCSAFQLKYVLTLQSCSHISPVLLLPSIIFKLN